MFLLDTPAPAGVSWPTSNSPGRKTVVALDR
jgi:hypothetical protein